MPEKGRANLLGTSWAPPDKLARPGGRVPQARPPGGLVHVGGMDPYTASRFRLRAYSQGGGRSEGRRTLDLGVVGAGQST